MSRKTTKKTSANTRKTKITPPVDPPKDDSPIAGNVTTTDDPTPSAPKEIKTERVKVNTAAGPSKASLARRKRELIDELRDERTSVARSAELHKIINTELADVPILSHQEISRLAA